MKAMRKIGLAVLAIVAFGVGAAGAQGVKDQLVGVWSIVTVVVEQPDGKKVEPFGPAPQGQFIFTADGHFSANIIRPGRPKFASNNRIAGTPEENKEAVAGNISVFGTYTVGSDGSVTQHIVGSSFPNWDGTTQKRHARITGDEMTWTNPTPAIGAGNVVQILKRAK